MKGQVDSKDKTMTTIKTLIHKFNRPIVCLTLLSSLTAAAPLIAADDAATQEAEQAHLPLTRKPTRPSSFNSFATSRSSSSTLTQQQLPVTSRS